jgi:glycosyltransferase involved in cell wall biosynthesis
VVEISDSGSAAASRFVSVVIPMRNEAAHVVACLESLAAQDVAEEGFEVIVADGDSTDSSTDLVSAWALRHPNVRLVRNSRRTTPFGLNEGIRNSRGVVVIILGAHATVAPDFIRENLRALEASGADAVGGSMDAVGQDAFSAAAAAAIASRFGVGSVAFRQAKEERFVDTAAFAAYRRDVFERVGLFDEELVRDQDDEFNYRLRARGGRIFLTPRIRSRYVARSSAARLWRQYFGYGFWKVRVLQKHPRTMQPRHFVPALSIGAGLALVLAGLFDSRALWAASALAAIYVACAVAASLWTASDGGWRRISRLLIIFPILHLGYGLGSLVGVIRFLPRWWIPETAPPMLGSHALER